MKTNTVVIALSLLIFVTGAAFAETEFNPVEQDLKSSAIIEITTSEVRIELLKADDGKERLEGQLDPERTLSVKERGNSLTIEIPPLNKIYSEEEVLKIFITDGKSISIRAGSGDVDIADLELSDLVVEAGSSDVSVNRTDGLMNVSVGSGDITILQSSGTKGLNSGSGDVTVKSSDGNISVSSSSGDITLDKTEGELSLSTNSGDIYGKVKATADSTFQSNSGDIELKFINAEEDLSFDLSSRSGTISLGKKESSGKLLSGSGSILITGRTSSGDQEYSIESKEKMKDSPDSKESEKSPKPEKSKEEK